MASATIPEVTDKTFQAEVLESELPVLVDFWAEWCVPCKRIAPLVAQLGEEMSGTIQVVKLDIQNNPKVAAAHRVVSIPTLVLFKDGKEAGRKVGAGNLRAMKTFVTSHL